MKKRYPIILSLILVCAVGYAHVGWLENFDSSRKNDFVKISKRSASKAAGSVNMLTGQPEADVAYAIVVMPKSYLPALKRFLRSRMARDLKILPAKIEWQEGRLLAIPQQAVSKAENSQTPPAQKANPGSGTAGEAEAKRILQNAAFILVLQGAVSGKLNYNRGRSPSSAGFNLHR